MTSLPTRLSLLIIAFGVTLFHKFDAAPVWEDTLMEESYPDVVRQDPTAILKVLLDSGAVRITEIRPLAESDFSFPSFRPDQLNLLCANGLDHSGEVSVDLPIGSFTIDLKKLNFLLEQRPNFANDLMAAARAGDENELMSGCGIHHQESSVDRIKRNINLTLNILAGHRRFKELARQHQTETVEERSEERDQNEDEEPGQPQSGASEETNERKLSTDAVPQAHFDVIVSKLNELRDVCIDYLERTSDDISVGLMGNVRKLCFSILEETYSVANR